MNDVWPKTVTEDLLYGEKGELWFTKTNIMNDLKNNMLLEFTTCLLFIDCMEHIITTAQT